MFKSFTSVVSANSQVEMSNKPLESKQKLSLPNYQWNFENPVELKEPANEHFQAAVNERNLSLEIDDNKLEALAGDYFKWLVELPAVRTLGTVISLVDRFER